jgi:hypothetical protein
MAGGNGETDQKWYQRAAPYGCLVASIVLVVVVDPPEKLVSFVGSSTWARIALALLVFLSLNIVLSALGLADGKIQLPFGLGIDKTGNERTDLAGLVALGSQLTVLREAETKRFDRVEELAQLQEATVERLDEIERRTRSDDPTAAGGP